MSITIHSKYKYFDSTVQRAGDGRQKFHFCRLPFAVNVMLDLSNVSEEEINLMKENAIPKNTKHATKFGITLFKGKM